MRNVNNTWVEVNDEEKVCREGGKREKSYDTIVMLS